MLQGRLPVNLTHIDIAYIDFHHPYLPDMNKLLNYLKFQHNTLVLYLNTNPLVDHFYQIKDASRHLKTCYIYVVFMKFWKFV